jgi:death-on-curing protein
VIASTEPYWLEEQELEAIHQEVIAVSGGLAGIRDRGMLASALAAVQALWHVAPEPPSLVDLAARLAYGLAKNHGFVDGNKRTAFIAAYAFLAMNGIAIQANQRSVVEAIEALASSTDDPGRAQERFADWLFSVTDATAQEGL